MKINKDVSKAVVAFIREDARRATASSYLSEYSFDSFCKEYKLYSAQDLHRINDTVIHCPFHDDESPSLSFNEERGIWHCFSCGRGGSYIDLVLKYKNEVLGHSISFYEQINQFLKNNTTMQRAVGAVSIYEMDNLTTLAPIEDRITVHGIDTVPHSYLELSTVMQKKRCSDKSIKYAILLMQSDIPPEEIYKLVFSSEVQG